MIAGTTVTLRASDEPPSFAEVRLAVVDAAGNAAGTCGLTGGSPEHRRATAFLDVADPALAEDALRALCRWAFDMVNLAKVEADVDDAALPLYERVGFVREVHRRGALWRDGGWHDEHLVGLLPEELR